MSVAVSQEHMAPERFVADIDYTPVVKDLLWDDVAKKPHKLWALIFDDPVAGDLMYPPLELFKVDGDEKGLLLGGLGILWALGWRGIGPMIEDREYVSGFDKLSNGDFDLDLQYWQRPSEDSRWAAAGGIATNAGGRNGDDVLAYDHKFPARPGHEFALTMAGVTGFGRIRARIIFEGIFAPPNLIAVLAWVATSTISVDGGAVTLGPIPKPQYITPYPTGWTIGPTHSTPDATTLVAGPNPKPDLVVGFSSGTDWSSASEMAFVGGELVCSPIPWPIINMTLDAGGWANTSLYPGDMVFSGGELLAGPVTQKQIIENPSMTTDLSNWYMNGVDAFGGTHDPDPGLFYWHATDGFENGPGATTDGIAFPYLRKYLRADPVDGGGVEEHPVTPGETYRGEAIIRFSPDVNPEAEAGIALVVPHPTDLPQGMRWYGSLKVTTRDEAERRILVEAEVTLGPGRNVLNALAEVTRHSAGYVTVDEFFVYRTKGNHASISANNPLTVVEGVNYRMSVDVTSVEDQQVGDVALRCHIFDAAANTLEVKEQAQSHTDLYTVRLDVDFTAPEDAVTMHPHIFARDILGQPFRVANARFYRTSHNSRSIHRSAFDITPNQKYTLGADFDSDVGTSGGTVTVGAIIFGPGKTPKRHIISSGPTEEDAAERKETTVTPPDGYTQCELYVLSEDISGAPMRVRNLSFIKADNNTDVTVGPTFEIVPDERYRADASVLSALETTHGSVSIGVRLTGAGQDDREELFSVDVTEGAIVADGTEIKAPPGYTHAAAVVRSKDVEGGPFTVTRFTFLKMDNNSDAAVGGATRVVTPERGYRWTHMVQASASLTRGTVKLAVTGTGPGYGPWNHESPAVDMTEGIGERKQIVFDFSPPSGHDVLAYRVVSTDVEGGVIVADSGEIRDTDTSTTVRDTWLDSPTDDEETVESEAPDGTESVRVAVIVEAGTSGWSVDTVSLARIGVTPATGEDIVAGLLVHPQTGNPLPIVAGTITAPEVITADWLIQHQTTRQALDHLCSVVYPTILEYRVLPTFPATIDVGASDDVCTTHPMADALLPEDRDVTELGNPTTDTSERPTEVTVLGAELETVNGRPFLITATAQVPGPVEYDPNNNPIVRTKYHQDATVDHIAFAQALAEDLAEREAVPALAVAVTLSGKQTRADSPPGDTVWAYHPESGLDDTSTDGVMIRGKTVFPRSGRVLRRERVHGPSHRIVFVKPDGTFVQFRQSDGSTGPNLPGVRWDREDAMVLTIGDRLPEWQADPQGLAPGRQYLRDRASRPR